MKIIPRRQDSLADMRRPFDYIRSWMEHEFEPWFGTEYVLGTSPLAIDVMDKNGDIVVKTAIPGVKEDDIDIRYENGMLIVQAESRTEKEEKDDNWYLQELNYGKFSRSVRLPADVKVDKAEAVLDQGILTIKLPKKEANPMQRIAVKAKELLNRN